MLAFDELWHKRGTFALIGLIVTLVAYLVLMMNALGAGLLDQAGSAVRRLDADALVFRADSNLSLQQSEISAQTVDAVARVDGIEATAPLGYLSVQPLDQPGKGTAAFLGYEPGTIAEPRVTSGRAIEPGERGVVLADERYLDLRGADVGDTVEISSRLSTSTFTIVGAVDRGSFFFQPPLWGSLEDWRELRYGSIGADRPAATLVMASGRGDVIDRIEAEVDGVDAATPAQTFESIPGVQPQRNTANAIEGFVLIIGALVVGIFFYVLTLQKVSQVGVLKAIGASSWFVFKQLLVQVLVISLVGLAIAVPLAVATERSLPGQIPLLLERNGVLFSMLLLLVTAIVGVAFSGRKIASVDPLIALGRQE